jgi:hypothetical protein
MASESISMMYFTNFSYYFVCLLVFAAKQQQQQQKYENNWSGRLYNLRVNLVT